MLRGAGASRPLSITIVASGKVRPTRSCCRVLVSTRRSASELVKKGRRPAPRSRTVVVVRPHGFGRAKGLHLRAIATMAPGTQLTITSGVGAKISTLRPRHCFPRRFEEPTEAKADAMDVDDDNGAAPMLVEPRPAEDHPPAHVRRARRRRRALDGGRRATLTRGLFDALDDDDAAADFPPRPPRGFVGRRLV